MASLSIHIRADASKRTLDSVIAFIFGEKVVMSVYGGWVGAWFVTRSAPELQAALGQFDRTRITAVALRTKDASYAGDPPLRPWPAVMMPATGVPRRYRARCDGLAAPWPDRAKAGI